MLSYCKLAMQETRCRHVFLTQVEKMTQKNSFSRRLLPIDDNDEQTCQFLCQILTSSTHLKHLLHDEFIRLGTITHVFEQVADENNLV